MSEPIANDFAEIAKRLRELEQEEPKPEPEPAPPPQMTNPYAMPTWNGQQWVSEFEELSMPRDETEWHHWMNWSNG